MEIITKFSYVSNSYLSLLTLETICYKTGLSVPLTRQNINHFLKDSDDDVYLNKLVGLIHNEISRLEAADKLKREQEARRTTVDTKVETPQENPLNVSTPSTVEKTEPQAPSQYSHFKNLDEFKPRSKKSNKRTYTVTATFEVEVDESLAPKLADLLKDKFAKANFKQIPTITVEEVRNVA